MMTPFDAPRAISGAPSRVEVLALPTLKHGDAVHSVLLGLLVLAGLLVLIR